MLGADVPIGPPDGGGPHHLRRRVSGSNRRAERFRDGRVLLIGDVDTVRRLAGHCCSTSPGNGGWAAALTDWSDQVDLITASPVESGVTGFLLRPYCYIAWASSEPLTTESGRTALREAAARWFGAPIAGAAHS